MGPRGEAEGRKRPGASQGGGSGVPRVRRHQRMRLAAVTIAAGSYTLDAVWLAVYSVLDATSAWVPVAYLLLGLATVSAFALIIARGWNLRWADSDMTLANVAVGYLVQLLFLQYAPDVGVVFLTNIFIVAAFGALSMNARQFSVSWLLVTLGVGFVLVTSTAPLIIPLGTPVLRIVTWAMFCSSVGRVVFLSRYVAQLRNRLRDRNAALRSAMDAVEELARVDELTGTWNRRAIMAFLEETLAVSRPGATPVSVAMLDIDFFKDVNDRHGHLVGDRVLARFAETATACLRPEDRLGRYGGEEFLLILGNTPASTAVKVVERIRKAMAGCDWEAVPAGVRITTSAGVAVLEPGDTVESLCARADEALYAAKRDGRDRVTFLAEEDGRTVPGMP